MKKLFVLAKTELKLTLRSPDIMIFVMLMPLVIVLLIGFIAREGMLAETYGAFLAIGICAVGLMGMPLALASYRQRKVLKRLQVTPASPVLLLGAQLFGAVLTAGISALLVAAAIRLFGVRVPGAGLRLAAAWIIVLMSIFSIGLMVASTAGDEKRAGIVASILYFPMLLLSGTTVPYPVFPDAVQTAGQVLPLRQGIILLNGVSAGGRLIDYPLQLAVLAGIALVCTLISIRTFRWTMD